MTTPPCDALEWAFLGSASSYSAFAGVLGGFVLAAMVVVLGQPDGGEKRVAALELFFSAFFILVLASFLFSDIAGEQVCMRAQTEGVVAAGLLTIGAVAIFSGIAWLFDLQGSGHGDLVRLARLIVYVTEVVAVLMLTLTVSELLNDLQTVTSTRIAGPPAWIFWPLNLSMILLLGVVTLRRPVDEKGRQQAIRLAAVTSIMTSLFSIAVYAAISALGRAVWEPFAPRLIVILTLCTSLLLPMLALVALARTLPRPQHAFTTVKIQQESANRDEAD